MSLTGSNNNQMESNQQNLHLDICIDFLEPQTIVFHKVGSLNEEHWLELINWWGNGGFVDPQLSSFSTKLDNYLSKRGLKDNWRQRVGK